MGPARAARPHQVARVARRHGVGLARAWALVSAHPAEVAGLTLDDGEEARATADYLRTGLAADIRLDESVGAVYTDPAAADKIRT